MIDMEEEKQPCKRRLILLFACLLRDVVIDAVNIILLCAWLLLVQ